MRSYLLLSIIALSSLFSSAGNLITLNSLEYEPGNECLLFLGKSISTTDSCTKVQFTVESSDMPFVVDSVQLVAHDAVFAPLAPVRICGRDSIVLGKHAEWNVSAEFPPLDIISDDDCLRVFSSCGTFDVRIEPIDVEENELEQLRNLYDTSVADYRKLCIAAGIVFLLSVVAIAAAVLLYRKRKAVYDKKEALLRDRLRLLADERFEILNAICNDYFEKCDSERARATIVSDVEGIIMHYRTPKGLEQLTLSVNEDKGGLLEKTMAQLPGLPTSDIQFLTYLYAGFSAKTVCLMTDIKLKNFYNRRTRLKEKILASDAPDRELFASMM